MFILKKIKYVLTKTRLPYVLLVALFGFGIWFVVGNLNQENTQANHVLNKWHTEHVAEMDADQHEIFKNRAQLNALSDEHNADLMQDMFNRMMRMQKQKHPKKLTTNPKYMKMTSEMMEIDDRDNNRINTLQHHVNRLRRKVNYDHPHGMITNILHHKNAPVYDKMVKNSVAFLMLMIMELAFITYVFNFKGIQLNKWRKSIEDKKRKRWIAEYGDDEGFAQAEDNDTQEESEIDEK